MAPGLAAGRHPPLRRPLRRSGRSAWQGVQVELRRTAAGLAAAAAAAGLIALGALAAAGPAGAGSAVAAAPVAGPVDESLRLDRLIGRRPLLVFAFHPL